MRTEFDRGRVLHLVVINAFVGGMVGIERTVLPLLADAEFGIASKVATLAFIATFGITKAGVNFFAGTLSERLGRKRLLVAGWLIGIPVPLILIGAPTWSWVLAAN
ncbi:MAG: MFS transporter, partial [Longimicrobiales bacterium]